MKKLVLLTLCIAGLFGCSQKRPSVIERPVFEVWNSTTIEIDKIEMSDSATVLYIDAYSKPNNWIRIRSGSYIRENESDEKLLITHSEGINLNEKTNIPESGTISFKLFYPPLKPGITKIDFVEDDCSDCSKIWGIHLLAGAKIKLDPLPKEFTTRQPLPPPGFSTQPMQVSGRNMSGYGFNVFTIFATYIINGSNNKTELPITDDGSFSGEIIPGVTSFSIFSTGYVFLVPGKELKFYTDLKKRSRYQSRYRTDKEPGDSIYTYISGCFTKTELDVIGQAANGMFDYQSLAQETEHMKPEEFKQHILRIMNMQIDEMKQKKYSANTQMMAENNIKLSTYNFLMQYESFIKYFAYLRENNLKPEERSEHAFEPEKPGDDYYSFLKGEVTDNMAYLPNFYSLARNLSDLFGLPDGKDKPAKERFACFKEKITPVIGTDKGLLFDLVKAQYYGTLIEDMKFFNDTDKQEIREAFKDNPVFAEVLITESDKLEALVAANRENKESILNDPPQVSREDMFDAILANYKGKVVLVDFWATWCGPCMAAMKTILPIKEEMKGKDVVFLYLTGETSPFAAFTETYPTISGEHYRVSDKQWAYWMNIFEIPGIPTYMIYDRQGKQLLKQVGFPGVNVIRQTIEKGL